MKPFSEANTTLLRGYNYGPGRNIGVHIGCRGIMFGSADGMRGATDFFSLRRVVFIWGCIGPQLAGGTCEGALEMSSGFS